MPIRKTFYANGVAYKSKIDFYRTFHPHEKNATQSDIEKFVYENSPEHREYKKKKTIEWSKRCREGAEIRMIQPFIANGIEYKNRIDFFNAFHPYEKNPTQRDIDNFAYHNSPEYRAKRKLKYIEWYHAKTSNEKKKCNKNNKHEIICI